MPVLTSIAVDVYDMACGFVHCGEGKLPVMRLEHLYHTGKVAVTRESRLVRTRTRIYLGFLSDGGEEGGKGDCETKSMAKKGYVGLKAEKVACHQCLSSIRQPKCF